MTPEQTEETKGAQTVGADTASADAGSPPAPSRRLKVFSGCFDGATETIVAATSQANAAKAFNVSLRMVATYGHETGNETDIRTAMSKPGVVFSAPANSSDYVEGLHRFSRNGPWPPLSSPEQTGGKSLGMSQTGDPL